DEMVGNDVIMDYRSGFPVPQSVVGVDWKKYDNAKERYHKQAGEASGGMRQDRGICRKHRGQLDEKDIPDVLHRRDKSEKSSRSCTYEPVSSIKEDNNFFRKLKILRNMLYNKDSYHYYPQEQNNKMKNSAGATSDAYEKMANTVEISQQKLSNAFFNLKVAVGNEIQDQINGIYDAGTDLLTWASEFIQENQWLIPIIESLVLTLG
ncbi:MAG: phage tail tape measure protein, partial [Acetatifactor sp.]